MDPKTTLEKQEDFYLNRPRNDDDHGEEEDLVDDVDDPTFTSPAQNKQPWQDGDELDIEDLPKK